jgi:hypothetical protein
VPGFKDSNWPEIVAPGANAKTSNAPVRESVRYHVAVLTHTAEHASCFRAGVKLFRKPNSKSCWYDGSLACESPSCADFIDFNAREKILEIVVGGTFEVLNATVVHPGQAKVPCAVFRGIARTLWFYRRKFITIAFLAGALRIDRTFYRHSSISVRAPCREHELVGTKPAKLQNL